MKHLRHDAGDSAIRLSPITKLSTILKLLEFIVYTNFNKAFVKVNHKMDNLEFPDWLLSWLNSYLNVRKQIV